MKNLKKLEKHRKLKIVFQSVGGTLIDPCCVKTKSTHITERCLVMELLTIKEISKRWKISEQMVRKYCRDGRIPEAVYKEGTWYLPTTTKKPAHKEWTRTENPAPKLVKQLQRQRTKKMYHGLYDYIHVNFCYSSNRMASNRLMLKQVEEIFRKGKVSVAFEPIKIDDAIEAYNHFTCVNYIIDTATERLTQSYICKLHSMLCYGTMAERKKTFYPGKYRTEKVTLKNAKPPQPAHIRSQMSKLLGEYECLDSIDMMKILDFHVKFERIHPFADCNGRVGRLLMFKECLRHEVTPFILDDKRRSAYLKGIREWDMDKSTLFMPCHEAQARFTAQYELQELRKYSKNYVTKNTTPTKLNTECLDYDWTVKFDTVERENTEVADN